MDSPKHKRARKLPDSFSSVLSRLSEEEIAEATVRTHILAEELFEGHAQGQDICLPVVQVGEPQKDSAQITIEDRAFAEGMLEPQAAAPAQEHTVEEPVAECKPRNLLEPLSAVQNPGSEGADQSQALAAPVAAVAASPAAPVAADSSPLDAAVQNPGSTSQALAAPVAADAAASSHTSGVEMELQPGPGCFSHAELSSMTVKELKGICESLQLKATGKKAELVNRILEHQKQLKFSPPKKGTFVDRMVTMAISTKRQKTSAEDISTELPAMEP